MAEEFAILLSDEFVCSADWIDRFKLHYSISHGKVSSETRAVDCETTAEWLNNCGHLCLKKYCPKSVSLTVPSRGMSGNHMQFNA
jgi:hypothetical protein